MTWVLRDSVNASGIPADTLMVAGYGDGLYQWTPDDWARFPDSVPLVIAVSAEHAGDVLDVERGDATPSDCPGWADRFDRPGRRLPTIYCDRSTIAAVREAMAGRPFDWWAATLDGTTEVEGAVAVQYLDAGPYDESVIQDLTWIGGKVATQLDDIQTQVDYLRRWVDENGDPLLRDVQKATETGTGVLGGAIAQVLSSVQAIQANLPASGALTPEQAQQLAAAAQAAARIETALKGA